MKPKRRILHYPGNWGMTVCGRDGWGGHLWSSWEAKDSIPFTDSRRHVTCKTCKRVLKAGYDPLKD